MSGSFGGLQRLAEFAARQIGQGFRPGAEIVVFVGEIGLLADDANRESPGAPALADAGIEHRRFAARIGADDQQSVGALDAGNGRIEQVACPAPCRLKHRAVLARVDIGAAKSRHQILEREQVFDRREIAGDGADALAVRRLHLGGDGGKGFLPGRRLQAAVHAQIGLVEPLGAQSVDHMAGLVGNPFLIHVVIAARQDAHHLAPARVDADRRSERIHHVDRLGLGQLPGPRREGIRLGGERADRAEIDHVALQLRGHRLLEIGGDLHVLAAADGAELGHAGDFGGKADAARALDAARHDGLDQRADIFVLDRALVLLIAAGVDAIGHRLVLQIAFAALIANRTIERMVDQQEFHHAFARLLHHRRLGADDFGRAVAVGRQVLDAHSAGGLRLRYPRDFDQAHAAIPGDREAFVEAEARNFRTRGFARLEQRVLRRDVDLFAVDNKLGHFSQVFSSVEAAPSSLLNVLVLAAPVVAFGGRPSGVPAGMVRQIGDHSRRRVTLAQTEDRAFAARLISGPFRCRPPEPAMVAP